MNTLHLANTSTTKSVAYFHRRFIAHFGHTGYMVDHANIILAVYDGKPKVAQHIV